MEKVPIRISSKGQMGRKKSKRAAPKKAFKAKLEKTFACPFCNHESAIECKLDRQRQIGTIACRICSAGYQTVINYLSEPVDVYGEWVDAIDAQEQKKKANRQDGDRPLPGQSTSRRSDNDASESDTGYNHRRKDDESEEEEEFTEDDLVDYREMPDRKRAKASEKASTQAPAPKSKRKAISSSDEDESEGLFGSDASSESEADFTDSEAEDSGVQSDEPEESD